MSHRSIALLLAALPLALASGPRGASAAPQATAAQMEADDALFQGLTTKVQGAIQQKDLATLDQLFAKDFAFSLLQAGKAAQVLNRDEFLKGAATSYNLERFELRHLAARVLGSVAVVRCQPVREASAGTRDASGEFVLIDTWVKEGSTWRLKFRYLARPDPGPAR